MQGLKKRMVGEVVFPQTAGNKELTRRCGPKSTIEPQGVFPALPAPPSTVDGGCHPASHPNASHLGLGTGNDQAAHNSPVVGDCQHPPERRYRSESRPAAPRAPLQIVSDQPERHMACERRQSPVAVGTEGQRATQEGKRLEGGIVRPYSRRAASLHRPELRAHRPGVLDAIRALPAHHAPGSLSSLEYPTHHQGQKTPSARVNGASEGHQITTLAVALWPIHGNAYAITLGEEVIVARSRAPVRDAARELLRRGFSGPFETIDCQTGQTRMRFPDIARAAR